MIRCIHRIDMRKFPNFGENTHFVVYWELASLGYDRKKCDLEWYDELVTRIYLWTKPNKAKEMR